MYNASVRIAMGNFHEQILPSCFSVKDQGPCINTELSRLQLAALDILCRCAAMHMLVLQIHLAHLMSTRAHLCTESVKACASYGFPCCLGWQCSAVLLLHAFPACFRDCQQPPRRNTGQVSWCDKGLECKQCLSVQVCVTCTANTRLEQGTG